MSKFIVNFNNNNYEILEISQEEMYNLGPNKNKDRNSYIPFGLTQHTNHKIYINKELCYEEKVRTLRHELMHAWMCSTANNGHREYDEEHICSMIEVSNDVIYKETERYIEENFKSGTEKLVDALKEIGKNM